MYDGVHAVQAAWGLYPFLKIGTMQVPVYPITMILAVTAGFSVYLRNIRRAGVSSGQPLIIVAASLLGGVLGAKLPIWCLNLGAWMNGAPCSWREILSGRTITGGLVGGMLAVWLVKRRLGIRTRYGNYLAPAIALGLVIGRVGCLLTGCCYGTPTHLPWGVNFGDGIPRHPTQAYEILFCLAAFIITQRVVHRVSPGRLLDGFFAAYFGLRFFEEFIRPGAWLAGLTLFQWICLAGLAGLAVKEWKSSRSRQAGEEGP